MAAAERGVIRLDGLELHDWCLACGTDLISWAPQVDKALANLWNPTGHAGSLFGTWGETRVEPLDLDSIKSAAQHFVDRRARAGVLWDARRDRDELCFGLIGMESEFDEIELKEGIVLRRVSDPPGEIELARVLADKRLISAVARHSAAITHELGVPRSFSDLDHARMNVGEWMISLLRCRSDIDVLVPVVVNGSWSAIAGAPDDSCNATMLEDVPRARRFTSGLVTEEHIRWTHQHIETWVHLLQIPAFALAVEALTTHQHQSSLRMVVASLWSGIEALFDVDRELTHQLAAFAACYLEARGPERLALYRRIKKLYATRSAAVHGGKLAGEVLVPHIVDVRTLLSRLVCAMVVDGKRATRTELEAMLLT